MRHFYYVQTGHRTGLDRYRRAFVIVKELQKLTPITLLCSDFRIASQARADGIDDSVGIDVPRNIANIAQRGDSLIFDSNEVSESMLEEMRAYFSKFIYVNDAPDATRAACEYLVSPYLEGENICKGTVIADDFFKKSETKIPLTLFFGDDDYEKDLEKHLDFVANLEPFFQSGFYFFLDYEAMLMRNFPKNGEFEDYENSIRNSKVLLTASAQAALESLACENNPIYFHRDEKNRDLIPLLEAYNIPIIQAYDRKLLLKILETLPSREYKKIVKTTHEIVNFIKKTLNL